MREVRYICLQSIVPSPSLSASRTMSSICSSVKSSPIDFITCRSSLASIVPLPSRSKILKASRSSASWSAFFPFRAIIVVNSAGSRSRSTPAPHQLSVRSHWEGRAYLKIQWFRYDPRRSRSWYLGAPLRRAQGPEIAWPFPAPRLRSLLLITIRKKKSYTLTPSKPFRSAILQYVPLLSSSYSTDVVSSVTMAVRTRGRHTKRANVSLKLINSSSLNEVV